MRPELDLHCPFLASTTGENQAVVASDEEEPCLVFTACWVAPIEIYLLACQAFIGLLSCNLPRPLGW